MSESSARLQLARKIEAKIERFNKQFYDTSVPPHRIWKEVEPYIAEDIYFKDPWQVGGGIEKYKLGLRGFHSMFYFDWDTYQTSVFLEEKRPGYNWIEGRAMIDGMMHLRQFSWIYTFPLRTIIVYKFRVYTEDDGASTNGKGETRFEIYNHEEMWSFGDMIQGLPLNSKPYQIFRNCFAAGFLVASSVASWFQATFRGGEWAQWE